MNITFPINSIKFDMCGEKSEVFKMYSKICQTLLLQSKPLQKILLTLQQLFVHSKFRNFLIKFYAEMLVQN